MHGCNFVFTQNIFTAYFSSIVVYNISLTKIKCPLNKIVEEKKRHVKWVEKK